MHASRPHCALVACATGFAILASVSASAQTTVTATWEKGNANWSDAKRWTDSPTGYGYPQNFGTTLFNINFGSGIATLTETITINNLSMTGGTIGGDFGLTVLGKATLSNATLNGSGVTLFGTDATTSQSGTLTLGARRTLENDGTYSWASTLNLGSGATFLNNGTVTSAGSSSRTATGANSTARFINAGTFTKTGTGTTTFRTLSFTNTGTVDVQAGTVNLASGAAILNTGTYTSSGTGTRTIASSDKTGRFTNDGTFVATTATTISGATFTNTGTVDVQAGTLALAGGGSSTGNFTGAGTVAFRGNYALDGGTVSTAKITFSGTGNTLGVAASLSGSAVTVSSAGAVTVGGAYDASATTIAGTATFNSADQTGTLALNSGGTLAGTGTLTVTGATTIAGGTMTGAGTTQLLKGATTSQTGALTLGAGRALINDGAYNWANTLALGGGATFLNNGTVTSAGSSSRTATGASSTARFINAGTFTKTGTGTTTFRTLPFTNTGTVDIQSGKLTLSGSAPQLAGGTVSGGTWIIGNGTSTATLAYTGTGNANITTIGEGASVTLRGTGSTFSQLNTLTTNQGAFSLLDRRNFTVAGTTGFTNSGTLTVGSGSTFTSTRGITNTGTLAGGGTIAGTVTSSGTLAPGASPGLMTFNNGLTLTSTNTTVMELGGTSRGITYDAINVGGTLTFAGTLDVVTYGSYETTLGTSYDLFDWSSATGTFSSVNLPTLGTSLSWDLSQLYTTGMITVVPEPATCAALAGVAAAAVAFWRRRRSR